MYSKIQSAVIHGIDGLCIEIEVKLSKGLPSYQIVGLPDKTIRESKERIRSAIESLGLSFPARRMTLNLIPAETPKDGSQLDLPMAVGILCALGELEQGGIDQIAFFGELALDGRLMPVPGILSMVSAVMKHKIKYIIVPKVLQTEASLIEGVMCFGANNLEEVFALLKDEGKFNRFSSDIRKINVVREKRSSIDFEDVIGQEMAKRALVISAAGFHNILVSGPPGSGKSMMFSAFKDILPDLTFSEAVEVRRILSVKNIANSESLSISRQFRKPHHNITPTAMTGGGVKLKPGELSLAHCGVLFLDELPEFSRSVIESLRQPLEDNCIHLSRLSGTTTMPTKIMFATTMNPCKCGYLFSLDRSCTCTTHEINTYLGKLSGPILDRLDLLVEVQRVDETLKQTNSMTTDLMRSLVKKAVRTQNERFEHISINFNSEMTSKEIEMYCLLTDQARFLFNESTKQFLFSKRVQDKLLKIARTIADVDGVAVIDLPHIAEAIQYRMAESRLRREKI